MANREQKLVDIVFQCVAVVTDPEYRDHFNAMTLEQRMDWVAKQLAACGFPTKSIGSRWGVLNG